MAKTKGFDLAAVLGSVSDLDTAEQIVRLPLDLLDPDPDNFYSLDGLDELAGNIELMGLLDPIRVRPNGERYTVVSGHRRRAAILLIRDGGSRQFEGGVPCIVEYGEASEAMRKLRLIYANASTRQLTSAEQSKQAEEVTRLLYELKEQGVEFPGRMRDHVAEACGVTKSKIARLHAIRAGCEPEYILEAFDQGKINESVAYIFSKLDRHIQRRIYVNHVRLGYKVEALTAEHVEKLGAIYEKLKKTNCRKSAGVWCISAEARFDYVQRLTHFEGVRANCLRGRCCIGCPEIGECEYACLKCSDERAQAITEADRLQQQRQTDLEMRQAAAERAKKEHDEESAAIWARIGRAAAETGRNLEGVLDQLWESDGDVQQILRFISGEEKDVQHYAIEFLDDCLIDLADLLGCSTDFLLGRTEAVRPAGILPHAPRSEACHSEEQSDEESPGPGDPSGEALRMAEKPTWITGTPEREGWYAVKVGFFATTVAQPRVFWWTGEEWLRDREKGLPIDRAFNVTGWLALPKEG